MASSVGYIIIFPECPRPFFKVLCSCTGAENAKYVGGGVVSID